jgi:hypothetical protein
VRAHVCHRVDVDLQPFAACSRTPRAVKLVKRHGASMQRGELAAVAADWVDLQRQFRCDRRVNRRKPRGGIGLERCIFRFDLR